MSINKDQNKSLSRSVVSLAVLGALSLWHGVAGAVEAPQFVGEITVTGTREESPRAETAETTDGIDQLAIKDTRPSHPSELLDQIPGVHVNVTGGEGHMTAIRQPLSTSPLYLYLEDGIPTRSTGFFNHNALYEVNIPQADRVEVTKGPGTSLYGSDGIGGVINVITRPSPTEKEIEASLEAGSYGWKRLLLSGGNGGDEAGFRTDLNLTHTDGWRDKTAYDRRSVTLRVDNIFENGGALKTLLAVSDIDQETAGSSRLLEDDYLNDPTKNLTPISYRKVSAVRLSTEYEKEGADSLFTITPYLRHNAMEYLANWSLSYDAGTNETASNSAGLLVKYRKDFAPNRTRLIVGADVDHTPGSHLERRIAAVKTGDIYTSYTEGDLSYDYDVTYTGVSPYLHLETSPSDRLRLSAGVRYDSMKYDYDNKLADGLYAVSDGVATKNYDHAPDSAVDFSHLSPKLGATYRFSDALNGFASYRHAFRAPSEGQLFRPGANNAVLTLELEPVKVDSYEIGVRGKMADAVDYELSLYSMNKRDDLVSYQDPATGDRYTVNAGETRHQGVELGVKAVLAEDWDLALSYSRVKHTYEEWLVNGTDFSGNEMEAAPGDMANMRLDYRPAALNGGRAQLEWVHLGEYWMDAANTYTYGGHDLANLRLNYFVEKSLELYGRVMNATDKRYATAARYTPAGWGPEKFEYAPGMPRTFYLGVNYKF